MAALISSGGASSPAGRASLSTPSAHGIVSGFILGRPDPRGSSSEPTARCSPTATRIRRSAGPLRQPPRRARSPGGGSRLDDRAVRRKGLRHTAAAGGCRRAQGNGLQRRERWRSGSSGAAHGSTASCRQPTSSHSLKKSMRRRSVLAGRARGRAHSRRSLRWSSMVTARGIISRPVSMRSSLRSSRL